MKPGRRVRMTKDFKRRMAETGSADHIREFGGCVGVVLGLTNYGSQQGPEVDVRWSPSNLRYAYHPSQLKRAR